MNEHHSLERMEKLHQIKMEKWEARKDFLMKVGPGIAILLAWTFFLIYRAVLEYIHTLGI